MGVIPKKHSHNVTKDHELDDLIRGPVVKVDPVQVEKSIEERMCGDAETACSGRR